MKKILCCILIFTLIPTILFSCWSYVGLNEITIVNGISIDFDATHKEFIVNFETVDTMNSSKETGINTVVIESKGPTIFAAVRNAKKKVCNKLFFGNCKVVIFSKDAVNDNGLADLFDFFIRDHEPRESLNLFITKDNLAKDILLCDALTGKIVSQVLFEMVQNTQYRSNAQKGYQLYEIYDQLKKGKQEIVLPLVCVTKEGERDVVNIDGCAIFKEEKIIGYLSSDETKYFLFITNSVKKGMLTFDINQDGTEETTCEILNSKTENKFSTLNDTIQFQYNIKLNVSINELQDGVRCVDQQDIVLLESKMNQIIENRVLDIIRKSHEKYNSDFIGVGKKIYMSNDNLWKTYEDQWNIIFPTVKIQVKCDTSISGTGSLD